MKKFLSYLLVLVTLLNVLVIDPSAIVIDDHKLLCKSCESTGDLDQNGTVDTDDAIHLLFYTLFPEHYDLHGHTADLDKNGKVDIDDALYLLFHSQFPANYPLPGCAYKTTLSAGYARVDITPEESMEIYSSTATSVHDPLQMTCTAIYDGENTALLFSLDLRSFSVDFTQQMTDLVEKQFNIPADHVLFNITHTHSAPAISNSTAAGTRWRQKILDQLVVVVREALDDLDAVESAYVGTGYTEGITFVRRYLMPDGTYDTNPGGKVVAHESEADNEMRTLRIDRKNKKDILMINYQTHYGSATGLYKGQYSADFVHVFREEAEKKWDCHFVYHSGASGNLNFNSVIGGERKYPTFVEATKEGFIPTVSDCLKGETKISLGNLRFASSQYVAPVYQDTPEDIEKALMINSSGYATDSAEYKKLLSENDFVSYRQVQGIVTRSKLEKTLDIPFYAISFGDVGFVSAPYEMFDTNGVQVREGSPFQMTFVLSYTNGGFGYVPSSLAFPHGGYEVFVSRFCETTGDDFADEMIRLLKECGAPKKTEPDLIGKIEIF